MTSSARFDLFARAAMLGLLAATSAACSEETGTDDDQAGSGGETGSVGNSEGSGGKSDGGDGTSTGGAVSTGGAGTTGGVSGESGGSGGEEPMGVLSEEVRKGLTLEAFTEECNEAGGAVETHAHCGGANTCKGFSYDSDTEVFSVHTCKGYNTCSGFSCVIPD